MKWTSQAIREQFCAFFQQSKHQVVPSSSLVPDDPTLLFVNAGMVQFKDYFIGQAQPSFKTAASVQACVRAGGKHNDLDQVGYTTRHHTFLKCWVILVLVIILKVRLFCMHGPF